MKYLPFLVLLVVSCSNLSLNFDGDLNNSDKISKSIRNKIKNMEIDKAISEYNEYSNNGKKWCIAYYSSNENCKRKSKKSPKHLTEDIEKAKSCKAPLLRCQSFSSFRKNDLEKCISDIKDNCNVSTPWYTEYPNKYDNLVNKINKQITTAKLGSIHMSKAELKRIDMCLVNWVWSFNKRKTRYTKELAFYARGTANHYPTGKFKSLKECNINRKKTPIEYRLGLYDNDLCFKRYVGENKLFCDKYL